MKSNERISAAYRWTKYFTAKLRVQAYTWAKLWVLPAEGYHGPMGYGTTANPCEPS